MAKKPDIVSEIFTDEDGNIVNSANEATRIEVVTRDPDGSLRSTIIVTRPAAD